VVAVGVAAEIFDAEAAGARPAVEAAVAVGGAEAGGEEVPAVSATVSSPGPQAVVANGRAAAREPGAPLLPIRAAVGVRMTIPPFGVNTCGGL
jgi:hypothetical protein